MNIELPQGLPEQAPIYRRVYVPGAEAANRARMVASALGFAGEPVSYSESAAEPEWTWVGPEPDAALSVDGSVAFQCSSPPAGDTGATNLRTAEQAVAAARAWLVARDLLPADCANDVQAWPEAGASVWEVRFRRRFNGLPVGSYWSWSGGVCVRLSAEGRVAFVEYVRRDVNKDRPVSLRSVQEAWDELQTTGPAFFDPGGHALPEYGTFTVTEVELGYHEGMIGASRVQNELRPYYVFSGRATVGSSGWARMAAYVPAWRQRSDR